MGVTFGLFSLTLLAVLFRRLRLKSRFYRIFFKSVKNYVWAFKGNLHIGHFDANVWQKISIDVIKCYYNELQTTTKISRRED
jgi:hypothetical protein